MLLATVAILTDCARYRINSIMVARLILNLKSAASFDENQTVARAARPDTHAMTMSRWEAAVLGDLGNDLGTGWTSEHSRTLPGFVMSTEGFGKDYIELGEGYPMKPEYGSYVYGYTGVDDSLPQGKRDRLYPLESKSDPSSPTRAESIIASALTEYDPTSPMLENTEAYETHAPPRPSRASDWDRIGVDYRHGYLDDAKSSNPYLDCPMEFAPGPPPNRTKSKGKCLFRTL